MKEHLELLHTKLQGVEDAYAELDAEHATLRDHSGNIIEQLTERLEGMQQACEELEVRANPCRCLFGANGPTGPHGVLTSLRH